jgi:hypothetical protein
MHWFLTEGGSSLAEETSSHMTALSLASANGRFAAVQYLLEEQGASISDTEDSGDTVWDNITRWLETSDITEYTDMSNVELSSLLKVMVMLEDAPSDFITRPQLLPQHSEICTRGQQLRAQLPSYLGQQRAAVVAHCTVPAVLQSIVAAYAATTPEDMWANGLDVRAPRAKRPRARLGAEVAKEKEREESAPVLRRSLRLRQKHT